MKGRAIDMCYLIDMKISAQGKNVWSINDMHQEFTVVVNCEDHEMSARPRMWVDLCAVICVNTYVIWDCASVIQAILTVLLSFSGSKRVLFVKF